ncbi:MAG: DHA2 family efflux MFS transporter permease subunit [Chloroflexi bacterium]|nr:DHA2 family efflux MFS transporter permease subunit [Chloroflexota bacterium]
MLDIPYKYQVAIIFVFGLFMDLMDTTIVNVAVPSLTREFRASTSAVEWTITGYLLSLAVVIPAAGFLSDRFGTKRIFLLAMGIFVLGSALSGQAQSIQELVAFRFVQGLGGGMMTPVGTAMLSREFPGVERAKASAIISIPVVVAPTMGPVLGGYLTEYVSWRWIFYVNLPVGIAGIILGWRLLREHKEAYAQNRIDIVGLVLGSGGAAMTLYAVSEAGSKGWTSTTVTGFGLAGLATLALFTFVELRIRFPILDLRLFRKWLFASGNMMMAPAFASFGGFILLFTLFLQQIQGYSPLQAGLIQAPSSIGTAISLPLASRLYPTMGPRKMLMIGFGFAAVTILPFSFVDLNTPLWVVVVLLLVRGMPFAFAAVASQTLIFGPLESSQQGPASSLYNTVRQIAASFGVALIITIALNRTRAHEASLMATQQLNAPTAQIIKQASVLGYQEAYLAVFALLAIPFLLAFFIDDRKAAATMQTRAMPAAAGAEH